MVQGDSSQVTLGNVKSLVNKFMTVNRFYGLLFVSFLNLDAVLVNDLVAEEMRGVYCNSLHFLLNMLALCFWVNQFIIALIR